MKKILLGFLLVSGLLVACSEESTKQFVPPSEKVEVIKDDSKLEVFQPAVDILFVVDDSGSMLSHQNLLAKNIPLFTAQFLKTADLDYHIGVVTTDTYLRSGKLFGTTRFVTKTTVGGDKILANNLQVGTNGSATERPYDAFLAALTPAMTSGYNAGFYRKEATLVLIFITDAEDQSTISDDEFYKRYMAIKDNDEEKLLAYGVLPASFDLGCYTQEDRPENIEKFLNRVNKGTPNIMSLCSQTYGKELASVGSDIARRVSRIIYLKRLPEKGTITVTLGNVPLPNDARLGWAYDRSRNAIILGDQINWDAQPVGAKINVTYRAINSN